MEKSKATKWEINELRILNNLYNTISVTKLAKQLGKSENAIYQMAKKLGYTRPKKEKMVQCFCSVKAKHKEEAKKLILKTIKKWQIKRNQ
jgi:hypothetical protein